MSFLRGLAVHKTVPGYAGALDTPCLILDLDALDHNLRSMQAAVDRARKHLRPHAKTHKCSALARRQVEAGAVGVCVAKVSEAETLVDAGIDNILITGPVATKRKIDRVVALCARTKSLLIAVDHADVAAGLHAAAQAAGVRLDVLLDVDLGLQRTGVAPSAAPALANYLCTLPGLRLRGIQAYAGQVQHIGDYAQRRQASLHCLRQMVPFFRTLRARMPTCDIFSASGTGTVDMDLDLAELTELQAGSYVCMDTEYLDIDWTGDAVRVAPFQPALRVLTSVVSANQPGFVTVDAGLKALYRDGGIPRVFASGDTQLNYDWFGDEYGRLSWPDGQEAPALGSTFELIPSHCDPTINLFDRFYLVRNGMPAGEWPIDLRGCSQ